MVFGFIWRFRPVSNQITRKTGSVLGAIDCFILELFPVAKYIISNIKTLSRRYLILKSDKESIGTRLKFARSSKKLSIPQVWEQTGISKGNLSIIENDKTKPSADALMKLSKLYEVDTDWILFGEMKEGDETQKYGLSVPVSNLELAVYFSRIAEIWERGDEETKAWVMVQLRRAFPEVGQKLKKG